MRFGGIRQDGPLEQRRIIREGMDASIVERVATNLLHLSVPTLLVHINLLCSTILRRIKRAERLTASESDRIARVLFVLEHAREVFASAELAAEWMQRGNAAWWPQTARGARQPTRLWIACGRGWCA